MTHDLKIQAEFFPFVLSGDKPFVVRRDDRGYCVGDTLQLREWQVDTHHPDGGTYTGRECERRVTYILPGGGWGVEHGYCVLGLAMVGEDKP